MANHTNHIDPFSGFTEAIAERIEFILDQKLKPYIEKMARPDTDSQLKDDGMYPTEFLARRWFPEKTLKQAKNSVYRIPEHELPRHRVGKGKGRVLFHGEEIREYEQTRRT